MLNITKEKKGNVLVIRLQGPIEESVNFDKLIGPPPAELHVVCKDVPRINSVGVKSWIKYFRGAEAKGTKVRLLECSTAIVEQICMIFDFAAGSTIESIYLPFACEKCKTELVGLFKTTDLKLMKLKIPDAECTKCGGRAVFDDIEEYLSFLNR